MSELQNATDDIKKLDKSIISTREEKEKTKFSKYIYDGENV